MSKETPSADEDLAGRCLDCGEFSCVCDLDEPDQDDWDEAEDEFDEALDNCHGWFEDGSKRFVCGAVGSEDCDECPFHRDLGMTAKEVEQRDIDEMEGP